MPRAQGAGFPVSGGAERTGFSDRLWPRHVLVGVLVATILGGFGLMALSRSPATTDAPGGSRLVENRTMVELGTLPGFQRRGNSVVGEVCTRDGQALRLVLDARNQTLIGFRLLEPNEARPGCLASPLPIARTPAN
ncbi:hypothetical protein [Rhabdaerophilum sp. SD176]|uniref:hypothetical protein n=1 Tax=Rhabdaerophilum sp. SD176 TaxID=2983548 RepID=UPI0024DF7E35|nr:hypothetical protein [Rhabdaerophilum sp. SD176]